LQQVSALPTQANPPIPQANALELNDIHVPEQVSNFPVAYGWWLLIALIILIVIFTIIKMRKTAKLNQVKKQALTQLKNTPNMSNSDIIALLKWAAMHYFSRAELAKLFGKSLQKFLMSKLPIKKQQNFTDLSEETFLNQYHADIPAQKDEKIKQAATLWLTHALPPKPIKDKNKTLDINQNIIQGVKA